MPREDFDLSEQPVLRIESPTPLYWRTVTYDRYDGRSMQSTIGAEQQYEGDTPLPVDPGGGWLRSPLELNVTVLASSATALFSADAPVAFSVPATINGRQVGWDLAGVRASSALLQRGQSYTVRALVARAGWRRAGQAGSRYPDWTQPYLELPATLPPRVGALAQQITSGALTPLDRTLAIEAHLRSLTYSTHAVVPADDRDWVDFLLFDSGGGYSDYFATAMTVLLRTQGIRPASRADSRRVSWRTGGTGWCARATRTPGSRSDFPGYGWQVFEPSAIRGRPERPESALASAESVEFGRGGDDVRPTRSTIWTPMNWEPGGVPPPSRGHQRWRGRAADLAGDGGAQPRRAALVGGICLGARPWVRATRPPPVRSACAAASSGVARPVALAATPRSWA